MLVADNPNDFCGAVVTLYQNETLWNHLSQHGLDIIAQHFSFAAVRTALLELLTDIEKKEANYGTLVGECNHSGLQR